ESTQEDAKKAANERYPHGSVFVANTQTNGKGRLGRSWHSTNNKGIWMSILLRPNLHPQQASLLTLLSATVVADILTHRTTQNIAIKWPDDILINNKKVAGILTEMKAESDHIQYVVIGIGLNVNQIISDLPPDIRHIATSIQIETGQCWNLHSMIQHILHTFEKHYKTFMENGFTPIKHKWEHYGYKMNENVQVKTIRQ